MLPSIIIYVRELIGNIAEPIASITNSTGGITKPTYDLRELILDFRELIGGIRENSFDLVLWSARRPTKVCAETNNVLGVKRSRSPPKTRR